MITAEKQPKNFKDFGIKTKVDHMEGKKINIYEILNKEVTIVRFKIEPSKYPKFDGDKCMHTQIIVDKEPRVLFTASKVLQDIILAVPEVDGFPFNTTIKKINDHFQFT